MPTTALYASLLAFLFVFLSVRVIRTRRGAHVALGDGGDRLLLRRMRVQANFAEYVPLALILIGLAESLGAPAALLHGLGTGLVAGRASHAFGVSRDPEDFRFRVAGMGATLTIILAAGATCLWRSLV
jgi:uncharacterized membrane protein YecN with MAPEG domain